MTQSIKRLQFPQDFWAETWRKYEKLYIVIDGFKWTIASVQKKKTDSGSTFLNNFMILPGSQIENLTCARLASSTTLYMRNVAGKMYIKKM